MLTFSGITTRRTPVIAMASLVIARFFASAVGGSTAKKHLHSLSGDTGRLRLIPLYRRSGPRPWSRFRPGLVERVPPGVDDSRYNTGPFVNHCEIVVGCGRAAVVIEVD